MELSQQRSVVAKGGNATHDFLSLYNQANAPSDCLSLGVDSGSMVETHDFLQPLERAEEKKERSPMAVEHILPGGLGTYSISHISYFNQQSFKKEGALTFPSEEKAKSTGFTLWNESSSSMNKPKHKSDQEDQLPNSDFSSPSSQLTNHKRLIDVMKSYKSGNQEEELEDDEETNLKREYSYSGGELTVRVDRKSLEQKANTPRSKHSATEQRRRSKINDRFQMLREIIPQSDQKRDKASFLLEVIEYIQFLQVKVRKYEEHLGNRSDGGAVDLSRGANTSLVISSDGDVEKLKEHEMRIEGGSISLSNVYSQGLLDTLTRALETSGVDLSEASLSVKIDIGKRASGRPGSSSQEMGNNETTCSRSPGIKAFKKPKIQ